MDFDKEILMMNEDEARKRARELLNENQVDLITKYMFLEQKLQKQKEVINKAIEKINDYKIYCEENKGLTEYTDIEIEAIEPVISKLEDILKEASE